MQWNRTGKHVSWIEGLYEHIVKFIQFGAIIVSKEWLISLSHRVIRMCKSRTKPFLKKALSKFHLGNSDQKLCNSCITFDNWQLELLLHCYNNIYYYLIFCSNLKSYKTYWCRVVSGNGTVPIECITWKNVWLSWDGFVIMFWFHKLSSLYWTWICDIFAILQKQVM